MTCSSRCDENGWRYSCTLNVGPMLGICMPSHTIDTLHEFSAACTGVTIAVQQDAWGFTMLPNLVSQFYSLTRTWALVSPETCLTICIMSQDSRRVPANRCTVPLSVEVAPALGRFLPFTSAKSSAKNSLKFKLLQTFATLTKEIHQ